MRLPSTTTGRGVLEWLRKKDLLKQDALLLGPPGPLRRRLALAYCSLFQRPHALVTIHPDSSESDLKQRREIRGLDSVFVDQPAVTAALQGHILILEGLEKAERNLLPVFNNLLEAREMHLEDGRFLMSPERFDRLLAEGHSIDPAVHTRVHPDFRVFALASPVPAFDGNPLDPPLRSRFQCRIVEAVSLQDRLAAAAPEDQLAVSRIVGFSEALRRAHRDSAVVGIPYLPDANLDAVLEMASARQDLPFDAVLGRTWPLAATLHADASKSIETAVYEMGLDERAPDRPSPAQRLAPLAIAATGVQAGALRVGDQALPIATGPGHVHDGPVLGHGGAAASLSDEQGAALCELLWDHALKRDSLLVSEPGQGKTRVVRAFAKKLGYTTFYTALFKDMPLHSLLLRRGTDPASGNTVWLPSPLVQAALEGQLAVLDGVDRLSPGSLTIIQRLTQDRQLDLGDGTRLLDAATFDALPDPRPAGLRRIHPAFHIIALAQTPPSALAGAGPGPRASWLTAELGTMFNLVQMPALSDAQERAILARDCPRLDTATLDKLFSFVGLLRSAAGPELSIRQLRRVARLAEAFPDDLVRGIDSVLLTRFLPDSAREHVDQALKLAGLDRAARGSPAARPPASADDIVRTASSLRIMDITMPVRPARDPSLVPDTHFVPMEEHVRILRDLLRDLSLGEHPLLMGAQGVGKNKLVNRLLHLLDRETEYVQLHRESSIQSLTVTTTLAGGRISWADSAVVRALEHGRVLIVDEADKAPLEVVAVLKSLVEDGECQLANGKTVISAARAKEAGQNPRHLVIHEDFRMIVLANPAKYPFLGNDFFSMCGDVFSCIVVDHPSRSSERLLIDSHAGSVAPRILDRLSAAFEDLRGLASQGILTYPFSSRELVSVVRHLEAFPRDGLLGALANVFDFDRFDPLVHRTIEATLNRHGIPAGYGSPELGQGGIRAQIAVSQALPEVRDGSVTVLDGPAPLRATSYGSPAQLLRTGRLSDIQWSDTQDETFRDMRREVFSEVQALFLQQAIHQSRLAGFMGTADGMLNMVAFHPLVLWMYDPARRQHAVAHLEELVAKASFSSAALFGQPLCGTSMDGRRLHLCWPDQNLLWRLDTITDEWSEFKLPSGPFVSRARAASGPVFSFAAAASSSSFGAGSARRFADRSGGFVAGDDDWVALLRPDGHRVSVFDLDSGVTADLRAPSSYPHRLSWIAKGSTTATAGACDPRVIVAGSADDPSQLVVFCISESTASVVQAGAHGDDTPSWLAEVSPGQDGKYVSSHARWHGGLWPLPVFARAEPDTEMQWFPRTDARQTLMSLGMAKPGLVVNAISDNRLEIVDPLVRSVREVGLPRASEHRESISEAVGMTELADGRLAVLQADGLVSIWQVDSAELAAELDEFRQMIGQGDGSYADLLPNDNRFDPSAPKEGKEDPDNTPHVGGNTWRGGTGGSDTAGLGGVGGPYRVDAGHPVYQVSDEVKKNVSAKVLDAARRMGREAYERRLQEIRMTEQESDLYLGLRGGVEAQIAQLRGVLEGLQSRNQERVWVRYQSSGELDDARLVDAAAGEANVYRKRMRPEDAGTFRRDVQNPRRVVFLADVSGSMYRFNSMDGRLNRLLESTVMVMEAFDGHQQRFVYEVRGHSGESDNVPFVAMGAAPQNDMERFRVIEEMHAHSQFCWSGDHTLQGIESAVRDLAPLRSVSEDLMVVAVSDANLRRYGIRPDDVAQRVRKAEDAGVRVCVVFVGQSGGEAQAIKAALGGSVYVVRDSKEFPGVLKGVLEGATGL